MITKAVSFSIIELSDFRRVNIMRFRLLFPVFIATLLLVFSCASTKNIQKVDGPDDYYEAETQSTETNPVEKEAASPKTDTKPQPVEKDSKSTVAPQPSPKTKAESKEPVKNSPTKASTSPPVENTPPPVKVEEAPIPQEVQEELGDDSWGKDDSRSKIKKKDKEKIKNSTPDDDKWGKE